MNNVNIAFDIIPDGERVPNGYQKIRCHVIFDVKIEDFRCKARLVSDGDMTGTPKCQTYYRVVSSETVRISLTIDDLNYLKVKAGDVINTYVTAPITKKVWTVLGNECGADVGKKAIIVCALYVLKNYRQALRKNLADCMRHGGYNPCPYNPNKWVNSEVDIDDDR